MEPFVCVNLIGGLGNQLFQYAAAKTVAKHQNCMILVNKEAENIHNTNGHNYAKELFTDTQEVDWPRGALGDWLFQSQGVNVFSQQDGFSPWDPSSIRAPCVLSGFFQYYPAIVNTIPEIKHILQNKGPTYPELQATFLHIRRGDYVEKADFHYLQGKDYYMKAIEYIKPTRLLVFSDDIEWCKQQEWLKTQTNVEFVEEQDEIKSFFLMTSCKEGAIIANSTFSWWAAIFSDARKVTYPTRWIGQQVYSLFPPTWICIT